MPSGWRAWRLRIWTNGVDCGGTAKNLWKKIRQKEFSSSPVSIIVILEFVFFLNFFEAFIKHHYYITRLHFSGFSGVVAAFFSPDDDTHAHALESVQKTAKRMWISIRGYAERMTKKKKKRFSEKSSRRPTARWFFSASGGGYADDVRVLYTRREIIIIFFFLLFHFLDNGDGGYCVAYTTTTMENADRV